MKIAQTDGNGLLIQLAADALARFRQESGTEKFVSLTASDLAGVLQSAKTSYPEAAKTLDVETIAKSLAYAVKIKIDPMQAIEDHCISETHATEIEEQGIS